MKILFILNVADKVNNFAFSSIVAAKKMNFDYYIAGNFNYINESEKCKDESKYGIKILQVDFCRNPFNFKNFKAFKELDYLFKLYHFDIVHCNTPIGGLIGRLVSLKNHVYKVIYQVHGFHFYKGSTLISWLIYYPVERILARSTDYLITINKEDFDRSLNFNLRKKDGKFYVPGVGIDLSLHHKSSEMFSSSKIFEKLKISYSDTILLSVGRLDKNKNNIILIKALKKLTNQKIHLILCGDGVQKNKLKKLTKKYKLESNVHFVGNVTNITDFYNIANIFVMASKREGLSRSIMEAMAHGMPCVVSNIRGNCDLVDENGGFLCNGVNDYVKSINILINNKNICVKMGNYNENKIQKFSSSNVIDNLETIYSKIVKE